MTDPAPWRCPECRTWIAPHVNEHRCDPPSGGVAVRPVIAPYSPPGTSTLPWPLIVTVAPGTTWWSGTGGGGGGAGTFPGDSVTVTAANACDVYGSCGHHSCAVLARPGLELIVDPAA